MLLDTSGLLCLNDRSERFHRSAVDHYRRATGRITHNYILCEFVALGHARGFPRKEILSYLNDLHRNGDIEVVWIDEALHHEALALLEKRLDKSYSLCDAASFSLMRRHDLIDALTTDHHFEQEGFQRLLKSP